MERTVTTYVHKPFALSWNMIVQDVLDGLQAKHGRKFSADDKEADDILKALFEKHKEYWGMGGEE